MSTILPQQPDAVTAGAAALHQAPPPDPAKLAAIGSMLTGRFKQYEWDRRSAELGWTRNARQYIGVYDPDIEQNMDRNRSKAYPKITRVKCVSMLSRLMNLLFPADDKNWTVSPSAVPEIEQEDLQNILDKLFPPPPPDSGMQPIGSAAAMPAPGAPPAQGDANPTPLSDDENEAINEAIMDFARKRARVMELEIEDQLQELGGGRSIDYVALCRKVLASGIKYGAGVLKGPFVEEQDVNAWVRGADGAVTAVKKKKYRPRFEFVSIWDYYPDMSAKTIHQMDGQFERVILTRHQLLALKERPDFIADQIEEAFKRNPNGNYVRRAYETELFAMGPQLNSASQGNGTAKNKYEAYIWEGYLTGQELQNAGNTIDSDKLNVDLKAQVWILGDVVIKAQLSPWEKLKGGHDIKAYHHFIFEENESFLLGNGLPNIVRDSQMSIAAAARMMIDNASIQRNMEVNLELLAPGQDVTSIQPDKIWYRDDDNPNITGNMPAVRSIDIPMHLSEMQQMLSTFQNFADTETFVGVGTGGDMQKGPSEPFRTAAGASMLRGDAALPFKDVVRNFDMFTVSVINAILIFNKNFNPGPTDGDFQPVARGATSLIAKEVMGIQLDSLSQTIQPEERPYVKWRNLIRAKARVRDMDVEDVVMNDKECDAADASTAQQQQQKDQNQQQLLSAQIREILTSAVKNISQAGKNNAASAADTANVILAAVDKGLNPDDITPQGQGANDGNQPAASQDGPGSPANGGSNVVPIGPGIAGAQAIAGNPSGQSGSSTAAMP
jgi:hypothetical protein